MDPLSRLFGSFARLKLLRLFMFNDDGSFTMADIAARTKVAKDTTRKEVNLLLAAGIIRKKAGKGPLQYAANRSFPHYDALKAFIRSTTSLGDAEITASIKKAGSVRLIVLSGLFTGAVETKADILVVGDKLDEKALDSAIRALEAKLGREFRFAAFSTEDFKYRRGVYDRLLRDIFDFPHRTLLDRIGLQ